MCDKTETVSVVFFADNCNSLDSELSRNQSWSSNILLERWGLKQFPIAFLINSAFVVNRAGFETTDLCNEFTSFSLQHLFTDACLLAFSGTCGMHWYLLYLWKGVQCQWRS